MISLTDVWSHRKQLSDPLTVNTKTTRTQFASSPCVVFLFHSFYSVLFSFWLSLQRIAMKIRRVIIAKHCNSFPSKAFWSLLNPLTRRHLFLHTPFVRVSLSVRTITKLVREDLSFTLYRIVCHFDAYDFCTRRSSHGLRFKDTLMMTVSFSFPGFSNFHEQSKEFRLPSIILRLSQEMMMNSR